MKKVKKSTKDVNALNGAELADLFSEFLGKNGHRDTLGALNKIAREWFKNDLILEEEDFSDEFEYLAYYKKLTEVPPLEVVRETLGDCLDCTYPLLVGRIEDKLGIPSTLMPDPSRGESIETA